MHQPQLTEAKAKRIEEQAHTAYSRGRYQEAESLYKQVLEMRRHLYSSDHPDLASSINNMAAIYEIKAQHLYREASEMRKRIQYEKLKRKADTLFESAKLSDNFLINLKIKELIELKKRS